MRMQTKKRSKVPFLSMRFHQLKIQNTELNEFIYYLPSNAKTVGPNFD